MEQSEVITIKVPKELKKQMKQLNINWSQYIRESIQQKVDQQKRKEAFLKLDQIRAKAKQVSNDELVGWIREDRER
jgi:hypothetical protein